MSDKHHGKRASRTVNSKIGIALVVIGGFILLIVAYFIVRDILAHVPLPPHPIVWKLMLSGGILGDPFRTTRKMKIPFHRRKGHAERNTESIFIIIIRVAFYATAIAWLAAQVFSNP